MIAPWSSRSPPLRVGIFAIFLAAFAFSGGFQMPQAVGSQGMRVWIGSNIMFVVGAVFVSIVDHWVGNLDRSNLRWLYVVMGVLGMGGSLMYQHVVKERAKIEQSGEART